MTEESDWSYASKQKTTGVKEVKRKALSERRVTAVLKSNECDLAVARSKNLIQSRPISEEVCFAEEHFKFKKATAAAF